MKLFELENITFNEIKNSCRQWLNEVDDDVYRGTNNIITDIKRIKPRTNRNPLSTSQFFNNVFNKRYSNRFERNDLVFCGSKTIAIPYGNPYIFIPEDGYEYIWFPIRDTFRLISCFMMFKESVSEDDFQKMISSTLKNGVEYAKKYQLESKISGKAIYGDVIQNRADEFFDKYENINTGINEAVSNNYEISVKCDYYYMIPTELMETTSGATGAGAIAGVNMGFDPDGDWRSIYNNKSKPKKKKQQPILRRNINESLSKQITSFLDSPLRNAHVKEPNFDHFYVRKSNRFIENENRKMFDLATIEVKPKKQRTGILYQLFNELKKELPRRGFDGIFIENVLTPEMAAWAEKNDFQKLNENESPSYYYLFEK